MLIVGKKEVFCRLVWRRVTLIFGCIILLPGSIVSGCDTGDQEVRSVRIDVKCWRTGRVMTGWLCAIFEMLCFSLF